MNLKLYYFVFIAAFILEGLGSYISILGLSSKSSIILIILTLALDFSKIVLASVLYKSWNKLNIMFKLILVPATFFLVVITTYGAYAFLLQEFSKTTSNQTELSAKYDSLVEEKTKLQARKENIDKQIADVPAAFVTQKKKTTDLFETELTYTNNRLIELDKQLPELKTTLSKDITQAGTMGSLAKAWGKTPEETTRIIAFLMVLVIDPLAIIMLMVANFLQIQHGEDLIVKEKNKIIEKAQHEEHELQQQLSKLRGNRTDKLKTNTVANNSAIGITSSGEVVTQDNPIAKPKQVKPIEELESKKTEVIPTPAETMQIKQSSWEQSKPQLPSSEDKFLIDDLLSDLPTDN